MLNEKDERNLSERQRRIYKFLKDNPVGVLATVNPDNEPHAVVIYFAVGKDFNIFFLTKKGTKKYDNIVKNNHSVLVVYNESEQTAAQVFGVAEEIKSNVEINKIAAQVIKINRSASDSFALPIARLKAGVYAALKIIPKQIRIACYDQSANTNCDQIFDSIESFVLKDDLV